MTEAVPTEAPVVVASIQVKNPIDALRSAETVTVALPDLDRLGIAPKQTLVVDAAGQALLSQWVDEDGDELADKLLFQVDLAPKESKQVFVRFGKRTLAPKEAYKVYGRFVRERHDDFAWENDRIARRMYGVGLESWPADPLVSSGIDSWSKRSSRLVINDWYLTDDYHHDNGEGADLYSVGKSRGCGGLGVWVNDSLHVSRNFVQSRVLANGPLRLIFELEYPEWSAGTLRVRETKRVTLDAGKQLERHESTFRLAKQQPGWQVALGIAKHKGSDVKLDPNGHWMRTWEPLEDGSHLGCGVVLPPSATGSMQQGATDYLLVTPVDAAARVVYSTGFAWDRAGQIADEAAWEREVQAEARALESPVVVQLAAESGGMPWSIRACTSRLRDDAASWQPDLGFLTTSCLRAAAKHQRAELLERAKKAADRLLAGKAPLDPSAGNLLFALYSLSEPPSDRERYELALRALHAQLAASQTTSLENAWSAAPWLARFARATGESAFYDEALRQLELLETHARQLLPGPGDSARAGTATARWARAAGWYALALVEVIEQLPASHAKRAALITRWKQLASGLASVQDSLTGTFWQVIDAAKRDKNYREASATALVAYALTRAGQQGLSNDPKLEAAARAAYRGMLEQFVDVDLTGRLELKQTCKDPGSGDHSYEHYTSAGTVINDATGLGAFVMASVARE